MSHSVFCQKCWHYAVKRQDYWNVLNCVSTHMHKWACWFRFRFCAFWRVLCLCPSPISTAETLCFQVWPGLAYRKAGARELSESCVSQNSGSLLTEQPCVLSQGGGSVRGCHPREILVNYGQIAYCSVFTAVISFNDFWKPMWGWPKSYLGAIGRNFVWAMAALAPWLPRPCRKVCWISPN